MPVMSATFLNSFAAREASLLKAPAYPAMLPDIPYLIVADESLPERGLTCRLLWRLLPELAILEAKHSEQVIRWLRKGQLAQNLPRLLLLDFDQPSLHSHRVLAFMRENDLHQVPVIGFSNSNLPEEEKKFLAGGVQALYAKPLNLAENLTMLSEILREHGGFSNPSYDKPTT
jgi:CheY-like chemotaxis protein